jgi:hypothetical protein
MPSKERIDKLTGVQARCALRFLLEKSYTVTAGAIWYIKIEEALTFAENQYPPDEQKS